jgi:hypothetical protein
VRLESTGPHTTLLHDTANAQVGGKIAQLGSRLIDMATQKMAGEFFTAFEPQLAARYPAAAEVAAPATEAPAQGVWARLVAWLRRLLG